MLYSQLKLFLFYGKLMVEEAKYARDNIDS